MLSALEMLCHPPPSVTGLNSLKEENLSTKDILPLFKHAKILTSIPVFSLYHLRLFCMWQEFRNQASVLGIQEFQQLFLSFQSKFALQTALTCQC